MGRSSKLLFIQRVIVRNYILINSECIVKILFFKAVLVVPVEESLRIKFIVSLVVDDFKLVRYAGPVADEKDALLVDAVF